MLIRTYSDSSTTASPSKAPPIEASEILNRILTSPPEVDIERERERLAQAQPRPPASDHSVDDVASPPAVAPAETRGAGSRHDHRKREKRMKFGDYILGSTIGEGEFSKVKLGWKQEGGVQACGKRWALTSLRSPFANRPSPRRLLSSLLKRMFLAATQAV